MLHWPCLRGRVLWTSRNASRSLWPPESFAFLVSVAVCVVYPAPVPKCRTRIPGYTPLSGLFIAPIMPRRLSGLGHGLAHVQSSKVMSSRL